MRMRALLGFLALAHLLLLGCSHMPPAALPGAVPCVSVTLVEECELADFTRIRTDHHVHGPNGVTVRHTWSGSTKETNAALGARLTGGQAR